MRWEGKVDIAQCVLTHTHMGSMGPKLASLLREGVESRAIWDEMGRITIKEHCFRGFEPPIAVCEYNTDKYGYFDNTNQVFATGIKVWPPCAIMAYLLIDRRTEMALEGANILELGAGVGLLGIIAVALGAENVAITEINDLCRNAIAINVSLNSDRIPGLLEKVHIAPLKYGRGEVEGYVKGYGSLRGQGPGPRCTYSLLLGTDVVYSDELVPALFETVESILERSKRARFLLGWVIRGPNTAGLLEEAAARCGLDWELLDVSLHLDKVYGELSKNKLFNFDTHERSSLRIWEFKWKGEALAGR